MVFLIAVIDGARALAVDPVACGGHLLSYCLLGIAKIGSMSLDRRMGTRCGRPFPIYENLVPELLAAHTPDRAQRDATLAHVLGIAAGYAYSDVETLSTIMSRVGLEDHACVRVAQTVDAMYIYSTAYLVQSGCGRVVILAYRGTEPTNLGNWLADADIGTASLTLGNEAVGVHAGFYRNVRATRAGVIDQLRLALNGKSVSAPDQPLEYPMQDLYVTGHSLGGAMAALFSLTLAASAEHSAIADTLRAVYTFGQPLTAGEPLPEVAHAIARKTFRHVNTGDLVPALPPAAWGRFAHFGREYRYADGAWRESDTPVAQLESVRELPRSLFALFAPEKSREAARYSMSRHAPHHYIEALRPKGRVTEFGDQE